MIKKLGQNRRGREREREMSLSLAVFVLYKSLYQVIWEPKAMFGCERNQYWFIDRMLELGTQRTEYRTVVASDSCALKYRLILVIACNELVDYSFEY